MKDITHCPCTICAPWCYRELKPGASREHHKLTDHVDYSEGRIELMNSKRVVRVRKGAFVASPHQATMESSYVQAELIQEEGNGVGQHWVRQLPMGSPLWVFDSYIHPEDLRE